MLKFYILRLQILFMVKCVFIGVMLLFVTVFSELSAQNKLFLRSGLLIDASDVKVDSINTIFTRNGSEQLIKNKRVFAVSSNEGTTYYFGRKARANRSKTPLYYPLNYRLSVAGEYVANLKGLGLSINYFFDKNLAYEGGLQLIDVKNNDLGTLDGTYVRLEFKKFITLRRRIRAFYGVSALFKDITIIPAFGLRGHVLPKFSLQSELGLGIGSDKRRLQSQRYESGFTLSLRLAYHFNINYDKKPKTIKQLLKQ